MAFDPSLKDDVIKNADIVKVISAYQPLTQHGKEYIGLCPFHNDSSPSMHVSPSKRIFKCFACGTGGDAIGYVMKREGLSYFEAMKKVAEISGYHDPRLEDKQFNKPVDEAKVPLFKCLHDLTVYYQYALSTEEGKLALDYLDKRGLDSEIRNKYLLGYAFLDGEATIKYLQSKGHSLKTIEDVGIASISNGVYKDKNAGRVIFPILDKDGRVIGYSARTLHNDDAKYVNTQGTALFYKSNVLYNYNVAKDKAHLDGYIYVLEGFMDVFALHKIGIDSAVALMGTALTEEHIKMLRALNVEIRLCLDGDLPGQIAMMKASKLLETGGLSYRLVDNQNSTKDPDEILISDGPNALRTYLSNLLSRVDFALNFYTNSSPLKTSEQKKQLIQQFIPILANIRSAIEYDSYCRKLSTITGYDVESIKKVVVDSKNNSNEKIKTIVDSYDPKNKQLRKLRLAEKELLYQMTNHKNAIEFYEDKVGGFYEDTYRQIANFIVEYSKTHSEVDVSGLINDISTSDLKNKEELINELTQIQFENNHPDVCDDKFLKGLLESICSEKDKLNEQDQMKQMLEGKSPQEQALILNDYNRRKAKKL